MLIQCCEEMGFKVSVALPPSGMGWFGRCAAVSLAAGQVHWASSLTGLCRCVCEALGTLLPFRILRNPCLPHAGTTLYLSARGK